ncbi:MAG: formylglycine-generating enzyme family protein, partial [Planctomycetes bacterium]|nr:formylglycine-generating enzyme family protein [Planctomycetota bacterium]
EGQADEQPRHRVKITKSFYMGMTEVTQAQWEAVMGTTPWEGKKHTPDSKNGPATFVSWKDAMMFCRKLSRRTGKKFRLPTEAEWEYACRAGTQTAYSFGDDPELFGKYGWFGKNSDRKPHAVAQKKPNPAGLYDMHGNVWELCLDYYAEDYYKNSPSADPKGPEEKGKRVKRGGSWRRGASLCRSASRYYFNRAYSDNFRTGGFRVVVTQNE